MSYDINPFNNITSEAETNNIQSLPIYSQPIKRETIYEDVKINKPIVMKATYNNLNADNQQYDYQSYASNNYDTTIYNQNGDILGNNNYDNIIYGQTTNLDNNNNYYTQKSTYAENNNYNYGSTYNNIIYDPKSTTTVNNSDGYNNYIYDTSNTTTTTTVNDANNYNNLAYDTNGTTITTTQDNVTNNYNTLYYDKGANIVTNNYDNGFYNQAATINTVTELNGTYNPPFITNVTEDTNISPVFPVPTLTTNEYGTSYNYIEQGKLSNGNNNIVYAPIETVTNEKKLSNSNVTFGKVSSREIDSNQINQNAIEVKTNLNNNLNTQKEQTPISIQKQPFTPVKKNENIAIVRKIVDTESNVNNANNVNNVNPNIIANIPKINQNFNKSPVREAKIPIINNIQTAPKVVERPITNNVIVESKAPKEVITNIVSNIPNEASMQKVVTVANNPNININQVSDERQDNPIYKTMNLQESKINMNDLSPNNINNKEDIGNNTVNIIDLRKGMENNLNTINPRYNIKTINNTLDDLKTKNKIELKNARLSKSPVNDYRSVIKTPTSSSSSKGFHKVRIVKKSPERYRNNNNGMNYNYDYDYLTYNYQNKNMNINPYPNNINNINSINNINVKRNNAFTNGNFVNSKNERKNSNSFVKVKKVDRRINNKDNMNINNNFNEFSNNTYNIKSNYNRNYGKKYENDFNDQNKINDNNNFNNISEIKYELNNSTDNEEIRKEQNNLNFKKKYVPMEYPTFDDDSMSDKKKKKNKYNCTVKKLNDNINERKNDNSYRNNEYNDDDDGQREEEEDKENNSKYKDGHHIDNISDDEKNDKKPEMNEISDSKIKRMKNNDGLDEFDNNFNNHDKFYNKMKNLFDD